MIILIIILVLIYSISAWLLMDLLKSLSKELNGDDNPKIGLLYGLIMLILNPIVWIIIGINLLCIKISNSKSYVSMKTKIMNSILEDEDIINELKSNENVKKRNEQEDESIDGGFSY